jgi:Histidine kinase-, DNA gyrase B-, and HSP90-like ATPase
VADREVEGFEELDLTPDPRILEVLGEIPYQPWQCLGELVDNSFDELISDPDRDSADPPAIHMTLPKATSSAADAVIGVVDTGRGMSQVALEKALRAGYSGRVRFGSLGLFGMGFNIATARLGNRTEVRTTQAGDTHWVVTEIDFREMQRRESFHVPLRHAAKDDPALHGTEITVRELNPKMLDSLKRPTTVTAVRQKLGRVYSYLLRDRSPIPEVPDAALAGRGIALYLNSKRIQPWLPCVWSASRKVSYRGAEIRAVQVVNHKLSEAYACMRCGHWQRHYDVDRCVECGSEQLELRSRRVHGWLGVQRYLHESEFGIDFLRHGRKILTGEKALFTWENPDTGETLYEYPIEIPYSQGRLVGEIHLDHVPVLYQKTDFDRSSREWRDVVLHLRGEGPMRRNKARERGYSENESPLGALFRAFQENDPGLRCLIPGDGRHATHDLAREWGMRYHQGLPEYQIDEKWYKAAAAHDKIKNDEHTRSSSDADTGEDLGDRTGISPLLIAAVPPTSPSPEETPSCLARVETEDERYARYKKEAREIYDLAGQVSVAGLGKRNVRVFETTAALEGTMGREVPAVSRVVSGMNLEVYVSGEHQVFREYGRDPRDYAIMEIAQVLRALAHDEAQMTAVAAEVTCQFPDQRTTDSALRDRAEATLRRVRDRSSPIVAARAAEMWASLPNEGKTRAERDAARVDPTLDWRAASQDGRFAVYLDCAGIATLVRHDPGAFLDGAVFTTSWAGWSDSQARDRQVSRVIRLLETIGEFLADPGHKSRIDLAMTRMSIDMLDQVVGGNE